VRSVSSSVQLPELPDARIETRKPMPNLAGPLAEIFAAVEDVRKVCGPRQFNLRLWLDGVGRSLSSTTTQPGVAVLLDSDPDFVTVCDYAIFAGFQAYFPG